MHCLCRSKDSKRNPRKWNGDTGRKPCEKWMAGTESDLLAENGKLVPVRNRGIAACAKVHLFCGKTEEEADEEEGEAKQMVWVTENGSVYHTDSSCSHINLSIQVSSPGALAWKRNQDGEKYKECEQCVGNGAAGAEVYYTKYGNRYHNSLSCKGLKRKVKLVALEQTDGLPQCSKCAKKAA